MEKNTRIDKQGMVLGNGRAAVLKHRPTRLNIDIIHTAVTSQSRNVVAWFVRLFVSARFFKEFRLGPKDTLGG